MIVGILGSALWDSVNSMRQLVLWTSWIATILQDMDSRPFSPSHYLSHGVDSLPTNLPQCNVVTKDKMLLFPVSSKV